MGAKRGVRRKAANRARCPTSMNKSDLNKFKIKAGRKAGRWLGTGFEHRSEQFGIANSCKEKCSASFKDFGLAFFSGIFRPWPVFRHFAPAFFPYAHNYLAFFSGQRQALYLSSANAPF